MFHEEGGARHHLWEERAEDQPVSGAGGAQLLSKVNLHHILWSWEAPFILICDLKMISVFACVGRSWMRRGVQDFFLKRSVLLLKKGGGSLKQRCSGSLWTTATAGLCVAHLTLTIGPFLTPLLRNLKSLFHLLCTLGKFGLGIKVFQTLYLKIKVSLFGFYSDDEEKSSLFGSSEVDGTEVDGADKPSESRIRNLWVTSQIPVWRLFRLCLLLKDALVRKKEMIQRQKDINVLLLSLFWSH